MAPKRPQQQAFILGVGMTKFVKPRGKIDYHELGYEAGIKALLDAGITYDAVEQGIACYCYGDSTCGQRVFYQFGLTGAPVINVNNNCSTGSTGLYMARQTVGSGAADCVMVVGFEKMAPGSLAGHWNDRQSPLQVFGEVMAETRGFTNSPGAAQQFGNAGLEYMEKYGAAAEDFAEIARVNHKHSKHNPYSQFQQEYTLDEILKSPKIFEMLTKLQCCPTSDGGAAAIVVNQTFLDKHPHLKDRAILIAGQTMMTDAPGVFASSSIDLVGYGMNKRAAREALAEAKVTVDDVKVVELHDCFSANEMCVIDALGLSAEGKAHELVRKGDITYGGKYVINPSGGLISKGHPLGASGIAQAAELVWHLRGWANNRSVPGTAACLQHNLGLGGAVVIAVYTRPDGKPATVLSDEAVGKLNGLGYNPATAARGFSKAQADSVRSASHADERALGDVQEKAEERFGANL